MEHKRCYVYEPDSQQIAKRQRIVRPSGLHRSWEKRRQDFEASWEHVNHGIDKALTAISEDVISRARVAFAEESSPASSETIRTCLVTTEPGSRARDALMSNIPRVQQRIDGEKRHVVIDAADMHDLKSALKKIVKECSNRDQDGLVDEDQSEAEESTTHKRTLGYDLQAIADDYQETQMGQCLVVIADAETCRPAVLSELIEYMALWLDRIPFALLICCAVPVEMLQRSLKQQALRKLDCKVAHAASCQDEIETVLDCILRDDQWNVLIGPHLLRAFLQRQHDYLSDVTMFVSSLKYASMSAFYANPLIEFLYAKDPSAMSRDLYSAIRTTTSFRTVVADLIDAGDNTYAATLMKDNRELYQHAGSTALHNACNVRNMFRIVKAIAGAHRVISPGKDVSVSALWLQCLSGTLRGSVTLRHLFLSIRKASLQLLLETLRPTQDVLRMEASSARDNPPESSEHSTRCQALLEVFASPASLTGTLQQNPIGSTVASFSADVASLLEDIINRNISNPKELLFHEIFLYDTTSPCREVLTPRPRHAVERALASPHDYLDCDCCASVHNGDGAAGSLSNTQPTTAVLYQLYLESGNMINVHDAWQAFNAIMGEEMEEEQKMALFQRSLAELRHLGMLKSTRRRVDHIAKTAWRGL